MIYKTLLTREQGTRRIDGASHAHRLLSIYDSTRTRRFDSYIYLIVISRIIAIVIVYSIVI